MQCSLQCELKESVPQLHETFFGFLSVNVNFCLSVQSIFCHCSKLETPYFAGTLRCFFLCKIVIRSWHSVALLMLVWRQHCVVRMEALLKARALFPLLVLVLRWGCSPTCLLMIAKVQQVVVLWGELCHESRMVFLGCVMPFNLPSDTAQITYLFKLICWTLFVDF